MRSRCAVSRWRRRLAKKRAARCAWKKPTCARPWRRPAGAERKTRRSRARAALDKARLDLANAHVIAPAQGTVTDLRTDVGHFVQPGAPVMTLVAEHDLWISADMTENNLGNIDVGDEAAIALDVLPGQVLKGKVRSIGRGVDTGEQSKSGSLPTVQNDRDWLRQAQRIPVQVDFDPEDVSRLKGARVGGQAEVLVYTGDNVVMNFLGAIYIRVASWLSYLY